MKGDIEKRIFCINSVFYSVVFIICWALVLVLVSRVDGTQAIFNNTVRISDNVISTGNVMVDPRLTFSPGTSKAGRMCDCESDDHESKEYKDSKDKNRDEKKEDELEDEQSRLIAQIINGQMCLDFGYISAGNKNNSPDVFRIKNNSPAPLSITFSLSTEIAPYFSRIQLHGDEVLLPGEEDRVEMKVETKPITTPGTYTGTLTISAGSSYVPRTIPVCFIVHAH